MRDFSQDTTAALFAKQRDLLTELELIADESRVILRLQDLAYLNAEIEARDAELHEAWTAMYAEVRRARDAHARAGEWAL